MEAVVDNTDIVGPTMASRIIRRSIKLAHPTFIWGPPGIGKSDLIKQIGATLHESPNDTLVIDLRLALMDPTDLRGFPLVISDVDGLPRMSWAPPEDLPSFELASRYKTVILFMDELTSAPPQVQAASYQLVLDRRIGKYQFPPNAVILAAGNREGDRGVTYAMPSPLKNRMTHLFMEARYEDWEPWALTNNIHPAVIGLLRYSNSSLFNFDPKSKDIAFSTPRSWERVSELMYSDDYVSRKVSRQEMQAEIGGKIGSGMASKFLAHIEVADELPSLDDIISGVVTSIDTAKFNRHLSVVHSLALELALRVRGSYSKVPDKEFAVMLNNTLRFVFNNVKAELVMFHLASLVAVNQRGETNFKIKPFLANDVRKQFRDDYIKYLAREEEANDN